MSKRLISKIYNPNDASEFIELGFEGIPSVTLDNENQFILDDDSTVEFKIKSYDYNYGKNGNDKTGENHRILLGQPTLVTSDTTNVLTTDYDKSQGGNLKGDALYMNLSYPEQYKEYSSILTLPGTTGKFVVLTLSITFQKWEYKFPKEQWVAKSETSAELKLYIVKSDEVFTFIPVGQNNAKIVSKGSTVISDKDYQRDRNGYTNPNLHRRIETPSIVTDEDKAQGILDYDYKLGIYGLNSYRTTEVITHDEESEISEIP